MLERADQTFTLPGGAGSGIPGDINGDGIVSQLEFDTVYGIYVTNSPWLYMTNVAGLGGTNVTFALSNSIAGSYYTVQYAVPFHRHQRPGKPEALLSSRLSVTQAAGQNNTDWK